MRHLSFLLFILILSVSSCSDDTLVLSSDQKPETRSALNNGLSSYSPSFKRIDNIGYTTFEVKCNEPGSNYFSTWIEIPIIDGKLHEYKVEVNGVLSEYSFKPTQSGWQCLTLTDNNNNLHPWS